MDPMSILGLTMQVAEILKVLLQFCRDAKSANTEVQSLSAELFALEGILRHVESSAATSTSSTTGLGQLVESTHQVLSGLQRAFAQLPSSSGITGAVRSLMWPLKKDEVNAQITKLERLKTLFILSLTGDSLSNQQDLLAEVRKIGRSVEDANTMREQERNEQLQGEMANWIAPVDPSTIHARARAAHQPGTGSWFLDGPLRHWLLQTPQDKGAVLWLCGRSGSGKTTLLAHAIESLRTWSADTDVAYFYCSFDNLASQNTVNILGSLAAQLARQEPDLLSQLKTLYYRSIKSPGTVLTSEELVSSIVINVHASHTFLIVDAINETEQPGTLVNALLSLAERLPSVRLIVSSTCTFTALLHHTDVRIAPYEVEMRTDLVSNDISRFVDDQFSHKPQFRRLSPGVREELRKAVIFNASGMFRYAQCLLDQLSSQRTPLAMRSALSTMPMTLNDSYARVLSSISSETGSQDHILLRKTLLWLCFAARPLTLLELSDAVVIDETTEDMTDLGDDSRLFEPSCLIDLAQGLVLYDSTSGIVSLSHSSVKTFLTSPYLQSSSRSISGFYLDETNSHHAITKTCLVLLQFHDLADSFSGHPIHTMRARPRAKYPLLDYADNYWTFHIKNPDQQLWKSISRFLAKRVREENSDTNGEEEVQENYSSWIRRISFPPGPRNMESTSPLYFAASFGHTPLLKAILQFDPEASTEEPGSRYGSTPLHVACWRGHRDTIKALIEHGADYNKPDPGLPSLYREQGESAASWARDRGDAELLALMAKRDGEGSGQYIE